MARDLNKVMLIGRLGADPEARSTPNGSTVVNFSLATGDTYKDKNTGQTVEKTEWHRIVVWDKLGEICKQYLHKGSLVYIEGRLQTRSWEDKETGKKNYITEIVATDMTMLDSKGERSASSPPTASMPTEHVSEMAPPKASAPRPKPTPDMPPPEAKNDDLPF